MTFFKKYSKNGSLEVYWYHDRLFGYVMIAENDSQLDDEEMEKDKSFLDTQSRITPLDLKNRGFQIK